MERQVDELTEKEIQCLIADYPWLLNLDYENIPELKNKGMEYLLTGNKRADLILRDRKSGRPVIVEFKAVPFYRENIGQILEYRARVLNEYSSENSILKKIFQQQICSPVLILVVPTCTCEARLACNLAGIEIYEYSKIVPKILDPEKKKTLDEFAFEMKADIIPFTTERCEYVDKIYDRIQKLMSEEGLLAGWENYDVPKGEYFTNVSHMFINKWLFRKNDISIGILENVFVDLKQIVIEYYSNSLNSLYKFKEEYQTLKLQPEIKKNIVQDNYYGCCWSFIINKKDFMNDIENTVRPFIHNYVTVMDKLKLKVL